MLLYLCKNETSTLFDEAADKISMHIVKLVGSHSLQDLVVTKMRKYSACACFCIDRDTVQENDSDFIEALQSFQMMYSAKIIVMRDSENGFDGFTNQLKNIGVTDVITAPDDDEKVAQFVMCLSDEKAEDHTVKGDVIFPILPVITPESLQPKALIRKSAAVAESKETEYRFDCINVKIGVVGATRRVGVTSFAMGFAHWIMAHGGTACYMVINAHGHLDSIAESYGFMSDGDFNYTHDGVDYIVEGGPLIDYNFIVYDFGYLTKEKIAAYKACDVHILCGANEYLHEISELSKALRPIKSINPYIAVYPLQKDLELVFKNEVCESPIIISKSPTMFEFLVNGEVYKELVEAYIVETQKRF